MLDIAEELHRWCLRAEPFAVATVSQVGGSTPRGPGAALAVDGAGTAVGSVSGGCVEAAVYDLCADVLADGRPLVRSFGFSTDDLFDIGLTCGGTVEVLIERIVPADRPEIVAFLAAAARRERVALVRPVADPAAGPGRALVVRPDHPDRGSLGAAELDRIAGDRARELLAAGTTGPLVPWPGHATRLLVESSVPAPRLLLFGAVDVAAALARLGSVLGYRVTVCDARPVFATPARFPAGVEVVVDWPHRYLATADVDARTVICVLTHDPKFDVPLLERALGLPVAYVGAMGSRRTHDDRLARLRAVGLDETRLARLRSPLGLDLGARSPEETALSIAAEIVSDRHGRSGLPLTGTSGTIHPPDRVRPSARPAPTRP
ncbi:xanthine dehydrogenase accessory factor [Actinacidiphila yanglinensis]|uniref:Xanthine dehydrogenase accessory factor n=1 Tax=Actinacidiphila yanglinensis TaxID=310779 RepID=A0A1H6C615_9ACTN|nr:XdhC/CoxI family protein [Actinacidiphila yanglinensis]SEG68411.1 xanthine dehydrogenase accessory factor [Actinacidiphila yanglinensis]